MTMAKSRLLDGCPSMPMGLDSLPSFLQGSFPGSQEIMPLLRQSGSGLNDEGNDLQVNYLFFFVVASGPTASSVCCSTTAGLSSAVSTL